MSQKLPAEKSMLDYTGFIYCPRCSNRALEKHHGNGMKCRKCNYTYFHNTASAVGAIIKAPEGILLTRRAKEPGAGYLDIPGGFVDYGEQLETALSREISEELHLNITEFKYLASFPNTYIYQDVTYFTTDTFFMCNYDGMTDPQPNDEISEIIYIKDIHSFQLDLLAFQSSRSAFTLYKNLIHK